MNGPPKVRHSSYNAENPDTSGEEATEALEEIKKIADEAKKPKDEAGESGDDAPKDKENLQIKSKHGKAKKGSNNKQNHKSDEVWDEMIDTLSDDKDFL